MRAARQTRAPRPCAPGCTCEACFSRRALANPLYLAGAGDMRLRCIVECELLGASLHDPRQRAVVRVVADRLRVLALKAAA